MKKIKGLFIGVLLISLFSINSLANEKTWTGYGITYGGTTVATGLKKPSISTSTGTVRYSLETADDWVNIYFDFYNEEGTKQITVETAYKSKGAYASYNFSENGLITTATYQVKAKRQNWWDGSLMSNGSIKL